MRFETFKSIFLSVGICECEFYLRSTNKEGFIGYTTMLKICLKKFRVMKLVIL